jgi:hypothetical protein
VFDKKREITFSDEFLAIKVPDSDSLEMPDPDSMNPKSATLVKIPFTFSCV